MEMEAYQDLVSDGGRPCYPIHLYDQVAANPREHRDMLRCWIGNDEDDWVVFYKQLTRWQTFRRWQRDNRGPLDIQPDIEASERAHERFARQYGPDWGITDEDRRANMVDIVTRRRTWEHHRDVEDGVRRKKDDDRFPAYQQALKTRLHRHGFSRSVTLDKNPKNQDPLTTWIEYLNFEYWNYDNATRTLEKLQPKYDAALAELLDSGVLLPGETPKSVSDPFFGFALGDQLAIRERAVESAKAMVAEAEKTPSQKAGVKEATAYLQRTIQAAEAMKKRCDRIYKFSRIHNKYHEAKRQMEEEQAKAQWALDQVPLAEEEMAESSQKAAAEGKENEAVVMEESGAQKEDAAGSGPRLQDTPRVSPISRNSPTIQSGRKRAGNDDLEELEQPSNKRRKLDHNSERSTSPPQRTTRSTHELQELSKSGDALAESSEPQLERAIRVLRSSTKAKKFEIRNDAPPLRRSARIATLKEKAAQEASKGKHHEDLVKRSSRKPSSKRRAAGVKKREPPKTKEAEEKRVTRRQPRKRL
jgi:hypothetical protein